MKKVNLIQVLVATLVLIAFGSWNLTLQAALDDAQASSEYYLDRAALAMVELDELAAELEEAKPENAFYEGMTTACIDLFSQNSPMLPKENILEICASYVASAIQAKAYPDNQLLQDFYNYSQGNPIGPQPHLPPPTPRNQSRQTLPGTQISIRNNYGTGLLGH